jgi:hypothetical protein
VLTVYMALAAIIEERDLVAYFGTQYEHYRQTVPMFIPRWSRTASTSKAAPKSSPTLQLAESEAR